MLAKIRILKCEFCGRIDADNQIGKIHEELGYCPFGEKNVKNKKPQK